VPLEAFDQVAGFGGWERFVERSLAVDVEVVLNQDNDLGVGKVRIGKVFEDVSIIHGGVAIRDLDVAPAFEWRCPVVEFMRRRSISGSCAALRSMRP
jgi:hypothetical protein